MVTAYPTLRLKLSMPTALKLQFLPAVPGFNASQAAALAANKVNRAGDTMTGALTLSADPATALQAATKQYVDAHSGGAPTGAEYITSTIDATLTNERVLTDTATITWDRTTAGQIKASTAVGGGNVSNSGTPTANQYGRWVTATTIAGVSPATVLSDIGAAPLVSPVFTGAPQLPTGTIGVTQTAGDNDTSIATTAFVTAAVAAAGGGGSGPPQGRLTLQTLTPVMITTQSAKTTIFYTPYVGNQIGLFNGTSIVMTTFAELSVATTDTTKSPAAIGASKVNDWFVWNDAGTIRVGHGPDWTSDTVRSAGTALVMVNGILLNNALITNGPAAQRGTYVGTTRSNASSQLDWIFGGINTAGFFGVWNAYNRRSVSSISKDSTSSWTYGTLDTWRAARGVTTTQTTIVFGLNEDPVDAEYMALGYPPSGGTIFAGIGIDTTTVASGIIAFSSDAAFSRSIQGLFLGYVGVGVHIIYPLERVNFVASGNFFGSLSSAESGIAVGFDA